MSKHYLEIEEAPPKRRVSLLELLSEISGSSGTTIKHTAKALVPLELSLEYPINKEFIQGMVADLESVELEDLGYLP